MQGRVLEAEQRAHDGLFLTLQKLTADGEMGVVRLRGDILVDVRASVPGARLSKSHTGVAQW